MAGLIQDKLYRVAVDHEYTFEYVHAKTKADLMAFLARDLGQTHEIFSVREFNKDGSLTTVPILTDPVYQQMHADAAVNRGEETKSLSSLLSDAHSRPIASEATNCRPADHELEHI